MAEPIQKALIYCRVSSKKQKKGSGLSSQKYRCIKYANEKKYQVDKIFNDDVSGGGDFDKRNGMMDLLRHLKRNKKTSYVVIFDDLKRFARDTRAHLKLKAEFTSYNASIECLNYRFEDSPEGTFIETIHAAQGQLEREQNKRQTIQKMRARLEQGYYVFRITGYIYEKQKGGGRILVPSEPLASIIKEALNGFASGRFQTQSEVKYFLEGFNEFPKGGNGEVSVQRVKDILNHYVYAGLVGHERWGISIRKGNHEPLISVETYKKNQKLLAGKAKVPARKNINEEFPLRGFILCNDCQKPFTSCFSRGELKTYPYYLCQTKGCESYGKSIRRADIEGEFEQLLHSITPSKKLYATSIIIFQNILAFRKEYLMKRTTMLKVQQVNINRKIEKLIDLIIEAKSPSLTQSYENRMNNLECEKLILDEKIAKCAPPIGGHNKIYRTVTKFLENPYVLWDTGVLSNQRAVLKLVFANNLTWARGKGLRTVEISLPFKMLESFSAQKMAKRNVVGPPRLERGTCRL